MEINDKLDELIAEQKRTNELLERQEQKKLRQQLAAQIAAKHGCNPSDVEVLVGDAGDPVMTYAIKRDPRHAPLAANVRVDLP